MSTGIEPELLLEREGKSFHWARRLLSARYAMRATRLYAFCRVVDDMGDEEADWEGLDLLRRNLAMGHRDTPEVADFLALCTECQIDTAIPTQLVEGVESDLGEVLVYDEAELLRYCYRVAGTVGLMMAQVLEARDPRAAAHAIDLGLAMQLTNLCRDVAEDARKGRRYLPTTLVGDLEPEDLEEPTPEVEARVLEAVRHLLALADRYYASGEAGLAYLPLRARLAILVAARVYRAIGAQLLARGSWRERAVVSSRDKLRVTVQALLGTLVTPGFWWPRGRHDDSLHAALQGLPTTAVLAHA